VDENDTYELDEYRQEEGSDLVRCAKCGALINAYARRCPECGIHFDGEAYDFAPRTGLKLPRALRWIAGAGLLLVVIAIAAALVLTYRR